MRAVDKHIDLVRDARDGGLNQDSEALSETDFDAEDEKINAEDGSVSEQEQEQNQEQDKAQKQAKEQQEKQEDEQRRRQQTLAQARDAAPATADATPTTEDVAPVVRIFPSPFAMRIRFNKFTWSSFSFPSSPPSPSS